MVTWCRRRAGTIGLAMVVASSSWLMPASYAGAQEAASGTVTGIVTDEATGAPLAEVCVGARDQTTQVTAESAATGPDGRYVIAPLPQGAYELAFQDCSEVPVYRDELHADRALDFWTSSGDVVWVGAGSTTVVDASLALGGAIAGTATWAHNGMPATACGGALRALPPDHWLRLLVGDVPEWQTCIGEPDPLFLGTPRGEGTPGEFVVGGLPPGDYVLGFGDCTCELGFYGGADRDHATMVTVSAGERVVIDVTIRPRPGLPEACEWEGWPASTYFDDVSDDSVHSAAIACLADLGLVRGTAPHVFAPEASLTRGELASVLAAALAHAGMLLPEAPADAFDDDTGSVHEPALDQLAAARLLLGTGPRTASPGDVLSRAQLASLVARSYEVVTGFELRSDGDGFGDDEGWLHEPRIDQAATARLLQGTSTGRFDPAGAVTRAQAATAIGRLVSLIEHDLQEVR